MLVDVIRRVVPWREDTGIAWRVNFYRSGFAPRTSLWLVQVLLMVAVE
jgi:hypothetical protein